ncbi:MAG: hypothetical protein HQM10_22220 [Candidatus Riflebacteria bacterium]|nr:hypothetical protein [Candidatus Riflebacteria bacterium]
MKKIIFILSLLILISSGSFAATFPEEFSNDIKIQSSRTCNLNAGLSFVYNTYYMFDKHVPVDAFLSNLVQTDLNMQFPDATLKNSEDFKKWYKGIGDSIKTQTHTVKSLKVKYGPHKSLLVHVIVHWQAENMKGEYISFLAEQNWTLVEEKGQLKIKDYLVKEAK